MYKNNLSLAGEDQIRPPRQLVIMEAVPVAKLVHQTTNQKFGTRPLALDPAHILAALKGCETVHYVLEFTIPRFVLGSTLSQSVFS